MVLPFDTVGAVGRTEGILERLGVEDGVGRALDSTVEVEAGQATTSTAGCKVARPVAWWSAAVCNVLTFGPIGPRATLCIVYQYVWSTVREEALIGTEAIFSVNAELLRDKRAPVLAGVGGTIGT